MESSNISFNLMPSEYSVTPMTEKQSLMSSQIILS